uniref:Large ribosomal subunit protein bL35m n=1 Tax=Corethrella appendiculata TaxID=1370023 RepID=U5EQL9_9DIPT
MFRRAASLVIRQYCYTKINPNSLKTSNHLNNLVRNFSSLQIASNSSSKTTNVLNLANQNQILKISANILPNYETKRNLIKFSLRSGKRKSVKAVLKRFKRLHWGIWIRTIAGRHKRMWRKTAARKRRVRQHVFCNASQSYKLDKMVTMYWKRPKYYVNDPYTPYHTRNEFSFTSSKRIPFSYE